MTRLVEKSRDALSVAPPECRAEEGLKPHCSACA